jgi:hypothetical protein
MKQIKYNLVITVNIFDRDVLHILSELLEVPVYGPDHFLLDFSSSYNCSS